MIYYTSDLHLSHKNSLSFDNRPFADIEEQKNTIKANFNAILTEKDTLYIIGDVGFKLSDHEWVRDNIKGHKVLIFGNHDPKKEAVMKCYENAFMLTKIKDNDDTVILCHFPFEVWDKCHFGSYHIYGHVHTQDGLLNARYHRYPAFIGINQYIPVTLSQLKDRYAERDAELIKNDRWLLSNKSFDERSKIEQNENTQSEEEITE